MSKKYTFTEFKRRSNVLFRLDVFPFIVLYSVLISGLIGEIFKLSDKISYKDVFDSFVYLLNFIQNLNSLNATITVPDGQGFNETMFSNSSGLGVLELDQTSNNVSEELQLIIDNIPIRYLVAIFITIVSNLFAFLMTCWSLRFKCIACFSKVKNTKSGSCLDLSPGTTHIMVTSSKYPRDLCPLKYSTCIEHVGKLKDFNRLTRIKSCYITNMNGSNVIQIDASDYIQHKLELERILAKNHPASSSSETVKWIKLVKFEKKTFIYDQSRGTFVKASYPISLPVKSYFDRFTHQGGLSRREVVLHNNLYGINNYEIPMEKFLDLFFEQIISPFFLFQIFCVLLWILDEYWQMSLFTLFMLCTLEAQMALRRLKESEELRNMRRPPCFIFVYREHTWRYISTDHLLPGDIIAISSFSCANPSSQKELDDGIVSSIAPCDFVLLSGNITVNEAMLTGECTPKIKVAMNLDENGGGDFSIDNYKNHLIFAGTNIILTRSSVSSENNELQSIIKKISNEYRNHSPSIGTSSNSLSLSNHRHSNGDGSNVSANSTSFIRYDNDDMICIGYVLRTGFNTYQGKLIRTISSSLEKISSCGLESFVFLLLLVLCSLAASSYILYHGLGDPSRNRFKLAISCIHIITSVIPPEFPITLSIAVTITVVHLSKKKIYCTEPFRIPFAGKLNICAFDKTGTLTSDKMIPHGLFGINLCNNDKVSCITFEESCNAKENDTSDTSNKQEQATLSSSAASLPFLSDLVMGCCNGLSLNGKTLVGDPMEKSIKHKSSWRIHHFSENNYHSLKDNSVFSIVKRYPFSPEEQRMTNIGVLQVHDSSTSDGGIGCGDFSSCPSYHSSLSKPSPKTYGVVISKGSPEMMLKFFNKENLDENLYKQVVHECARKGYRILALGSKYFCTKQVNNNLRREFFEDGLTFCGFLALYCPIKKHSKSVVENLNNSNHQCIMITGDNILTAFHVAKNVSIVKEDQSILTLSKPDDNDGITTTTNITSSNNYIWKRSNGTVFEKFQDDLNHLVKLNREFHFGITGPVFESLVEDFKDTKVLEKFVLLTRIYARMSPKNKQTLICLYNRMGKMTLMCGDGTNDVGALKHSHVGISLLSNEFESTSPSSSAKENKHKPLGGVGGGTKNKKKFNFFEIKKDIEDRIKRGEKLTKAQIKEEIMRELQEMEEVPKVKLGDASIASPFTYKGESPSCIIKLVRYGRATMTTLLLMYKLMGLNSIVSAFSMSVLAYDGVKFGDFQTTIESVIMSSLFFLVLRNKPAKELVTQRPPSSIFSPMVFLSFLTQALIHLFVIYFGWKISYSLVPLDRPMNIDGPFEPNAINTSMYYLYTTCHLACFLANAQGYPFTTPISRNKYLVYTSAFVISFLVTSIMGIFPHLNALLSLQMLNNKYHQLTMLLLVLFDIFGTLYVNHFFNKLHIYFDKAC